MNIAIILASGVGKRMGAGKNKTLINIGGKPIIFYTLEAFENSKDIDGIVLVVGKSDISKFKKIIEKYKFNKIIGIIAGGSERQDSAYNAIEFINNSIKNNKDALAIFHNGANPFVSPEEIGNSIKEAKRWGASVIAHKTKDTIREVDEEGLSIRVMDRSKLWNMQTPQVIQFPLAIKAFAKAKEDKFMGTDDVSLVERLGEKVKIVEGSVDNIKITTPLDLELAKIILKKRHRLQ